jgi:hypothetical protein
MPALTRRVRTARIGDRDFAEVTGRLVETTSAQGRTSWYADLALEGTVPVQVGDQTAPAAVELVTDDGVFSGHGFITRPSYTSAGGSAVTRLRLEGSEPPTD